MNEIRTMLVDDSAFSTAVLRKMIERKGCTVVAIAKNVSEAIEMAKEHKPDLITMDMTLPDGDGIECAKSILAHVKEAKIIAISSMMDAEIIKKAKEAGMKTYLQKPVEEEELGSAIERLFLGDMLYELLQQNYQEAFKESMFNYFKRSLGYTVQFNNANIEDPTSIKSSGISIAVGIIGRHSGRFIIDLSDNTALAFTKKMLKEDNVTVEDAVLFLSEFANVISGNSCSLLNGLNRSLGLRVSPPMIFHGNDLTVSIGGIESSSFLIQTELGEIFMNIGFKKEDVQWM